MFNRFKYIAISLFILLGVVLGFFIASDSSFALVGYGLIGGVGVTFLLGIILKVLPLTYAWHTTVLRFGLLFSFFSVLLVFWMVPMVRTGLSINSEPLLLNVEELQAQKFSTPRYVVVTGLFDEALAVRKSYQVRTRSSNKSSYQTETRYYCRSPILSRSRTIDVMTDQCAPYTVQPSRYMKRFAGILYPVCSDKGIACNELWPAFVAGDQVLQVNAGYALHETRGYFLRTGESPARTYLSPLLFAGLAVLIWIGLVMKLECFAKAPELRQKRKRSSEAQPSVAALVKPEADDGIVPVEEINYTESGPEQRMEDALQSNPSEIEALDLTAYWESYKAERPLKYLSSSIGEFISLKSLGLLWNHLSDIPSEISRLTKLEELVLACNPLCKLPESLQSLRSLRVLDIERCSLQQLPDWVGCFSNLEILKAPDNRMKALPDAICRLARLQKLDLKQNALQILPDCWGSLSNLTHLDLSQNQVRQLPESILQLARLKELNLSENQLVELSGAVQAECAGLEVLELQGNTLSHWPEWLQSLGNLKVLHFGPTVHFVRNANRLVAVSDSIANLKRLHTLTLSLAKDAVVSESFGALPQLKELRLCAFRTPRAVTALSGLKTLALIGLWDESKPLEGDWGRLSHLETLEIEIASAALIPDALIAIHSLKTFTLRCKKINDYQKDRLKRLKAAHCKVEIELARSDRKIEL